MAAQGFPTVDSWEVVVGAQDAPGLARGTPAAQLLGGGGGGRQAVLGWDGEG